MVLIGATEDDRCIPELGAELVRQLEQCLRLRHLDDRGDPAGAVAIQRLCGERVDIDGAVRASPPRRALELLGTRT